VITGIGSDNAVYCERAIRTNAIRALILAGEQTTIGQHVTLTGILSQDADLCGPVLQQATVTQQEGSGEIKPLGMTARSLNGNDVSSLRNCWMLVRVFGSVSGLIMNGEGCSFYINDGSVDGQGVYVTCRFTPPAGLADEAYVSVDGVCKISQSLGRQIEVMKTNGIQLIN